MSKQNLTPQIQGQSTGFSRAKRKAVPLKLAIQGVSFSGKTMSAIKLAKGLAGQDKPVCVIDTENETAAFYDWLEFEHAVIRPPFLPSKYIDLIRQAVAMNAVIVIDTGSHAWQYILDYKDQLDGGAPKWSNWGKAKPLWSTLKDAILQSPADIIVTFREKAEYAVDQSDDGRGKKSEVKKMGTKAIAEEGSEYEFTVVWKLDRDTHIAKVEKDRTGLFDGRTFIIDEQIGRDLLAWRGAGALESGAEWALLSQSNPGEFREAQDRSEQVRRDLAKSILSRVRLKQAVGRALTTAATAANEDVASLVIDADRYGATSAEQVIRFVASKISLDPVALVAAQLDPTVPLSEQRANPNGGTPAAERTPDEAWAALALPEPDEMRLELSVKIKDKKAGDPDQIAIAMAKAGLKGFLAAIQYVNELPVQEVATDKAVEPAGGSEVQEVPSQAEAVQDAITDVDQADAVAGAKKAPKKKVDA